LMGVLNPPAGAESPEGEPWGWGPAALMGVLNPPAGAESPARLRQGFGGSAEAGKHERQRRRKGEPWLWGPAALKLSYRYCR